MLAGIAAIVAIVAYRARPAEPPPPGADAKASPAAVTAAPVASGASAPRADAQYVGSAACLDCHAAQHAAWQRSQHAQAMQPATAQSVLGNFADARFTHAGVTSTFFRRDGRYYVRTEGRDGRLADFPIAYTFGVAPLQQYLIEMPGGRLQAFGVAWDARPASAGGQRWFHLYPGRRLKAGEPLHWTGIDQNWNYQCADCHATNLRKNYDDAKRAFATSWTELGVGCEACHGPGSAHVRWANEPGERRAGDASLGLAVRLDERAGATWTIDPATGNASRSRPRASSREIDACARCHARRGQFSDAWVAGQAPGDAFRIAPIEPGLYHPDGQMRDEVFNHGSFLQSRMHAKGVTCSDCHDPHSQALRAPGNAVCGQCHAPGRYDVPAHHHHPPGSPGAACAACHMPTTTYMVVDPRHDHSMRLPRPDRSVTLGVPNACDRCHAKQGARWAADTVPRWYPDAKPGAQSFAEAFAAGDRGAPGAGAALAAIVRDVGQPALVRASAIPRLAANATPDAADVIAAATRDRDALVREAAARALRDADPALRSRVLPPLLDDPVRVVRMEAVRGLVGHPTWRPDAARAPAFARALDDATAAARFNADRPEAQVDLADLALAQGRPDDAVAALRRALEIDPAYTPAAVNLADVHRRRGDEQGAEAVLRAAATNDPNAAGAWHALGLSLVRQRRTPEAIAALAEAARLGPADPRYAYVYAVALHDTGRRTDAMRVLDKALAQHAYDRPLLVAALTYAREAGDAAGASKRAGVLLELDPDNAELQALARELGRPRDAPPRAPGGGSGVR